MSYERTRESVLANQDVPIERTLRDRIAELEAALQDKCHDFPETDYVPFCDGCDGYQREKFGKCRTDDLQRQLAEARQEVERLKAWERASQEGHPTPCTLGPLCPYCEIERLQSALAVARHEIERLKGALAAKPDDNERTQALIDAVARGNRLQAEVATLRADADRLDWLEGEVDQERQERELMGRVVTRSLFRRNEPITRAAIDAARAAGGEH